MRHAKSLDAQKCKTRIATRPQNREGRPLLTVPYTVRCCPHIVFDDGAPLYTMYDPSIPTKLHCAPLLIGEERQDHGDRVTLTATRRGDPGCVGMIHAKYPTHAYTHVFFLSFMRTVRPDEGRAPSPCLSFLSLSLFPSLYSCASDAGLG